MEKHIEQSLTKNTEFITLSIKIKNDGQKEEIKNLLQTYNHFENILLDLIIQNYNLYIEGKDTNDFELLTSSQLIVNALHNDKSKYSEQLEYLKTKYENNKLWKELKETANRLNPYNLIYVIKRVKKRVETNSKFYIKNLERYEQNPILLEEVMSLLKPRDLSELKNYSIELDKYKSLSFERLEKENLIGINLSKGIVHINVNKKQMKKLKEIDRLYSVRVVYDNGNLYLQIIYLRELQIIHLKELSKTERDIVKYDETENNQIKYETGNETDNDRIKYAGIDMGETNIIAMFIDDKITPSLLVDGKPFRDYNEKFNEIIAKLKARMIKEAVEWDISKDETRCPIKYTEKGEKIGNFILFLCSERNKFFTDQFHKIAKNVVDYLDLHGVTDLFLSKNLAESKNDGECEAIKVVRQNSIQVVEHNFIQIPLAMLIKYIDQKAKEYGIRVHYIDESYTSQVSCISGDINRIQETPNLANAFNGKRRDELFHDTVINKKFHADINAAVNHIKVGTGKSFEWLKDKLFKLSKPVKVKVKVDIDIIDIIIDTIFDAFP